jgi:hypothetical protein
MYSYSLSSMGVLVTCHPLIQDVFHAAIDIRDISLTSGIRSEKEQNDLFDAVPPRTKLRFPDSAHNRALNPTGTVSIEPSMQSRAIDAIPYPTGTSDWNNRDYWIEWSSWVKGFAAGMGVHLISGYDWDNDYNYSLDEQTFWDGPHFELRDIE